MANPTNATNPAHAAEPILPAGPRILGGVLSLLVPGLGHIFQGIVARAPGRLYKGIFFAVTLWGMFFYGMHMAKWQNVYLPHLAEGNPVSFTFGLFGRNVRWELTPTQGNLYYRLHYVGQFWIGTAAWPALVHYYAPDSKLSQWLGDFQRMPPGGKTLEQAEEDLNALQFAEGMGRLWDIAWAYTVIAGVLNILVIFDAFIGPVRPRFSASSEKRAEPSSTADRQQTPAVTPSERRPT